MFKLLGSCKINVQDLTQARYETNNASSGNPDDEKANFETNKQKDISPFQDCRIIYQNANFEIELGARGNSSNYLVKRICHSSLGLKFVLAALKCKKVFIC